MGPHASPHHRRPARATAILTAFGIIAGLAVTTAPATAAPHGVTGALEAPAPYAAITAWGFGSGTDYQGLMQGPGGIALACIEPLVGLPLGATADAGIQTSVTSNAPGYGRTLTDLEHAQINAAMIRYAADTSQITRASGFALWQAVKNRANPAAFNAETNGMGLNWWRALAPSQAEWNDAVRLYDEINNYMDTVGLPAAVPEQGEIDAIIQVDQNSDWTGRLIIASMQAGGRPIEQATGTMTFLENGVFKDTGTTTITGTFSTGQVIELTGDPAVNTGPEGYKFKLRGDLIAGNPNGAPAASLHVWNTPGGQTTVSAGDMANTQVVLSFLKDDPTTRQVPQLSSHAQVEASPGSDDSDVVHVTGGANAFPVGGVDVVVDAYLMPGQEPVPGQSLADGTKIWSAPVQNTSAAGDLVFTTETLPESALAGMHVVKVATMTNHATGAVIQVGAFDDPDEWTPIREVELSTIPQVHEAAYAQDEIDVQGWIKPGDQVDVVLYAVPLGETLVCTTQNQVGTPLAAIDLTPGLNEHTKYVTQKTGALVPGIQYGFVERLWRDGKIVKTGGCLDELFTTETPEPPAPPATPPTPKLPVIAG